MKNNFNIFIAFFILMVKTQLTSNLYAEEILNDFAENEKKIIEEKKGQLTANSDILIIPNSPACKKLHDTYIQSVREILDRRIKAIAESLRQTYPNSPIFNKSNVCGDGLSKDKSMLTFENRLNHFVKQNCNVKNPVDIIIKFYNDCVILREEMPEKSKVADFIKNGMSSDSRARASSVCEDPSSVKVNSRGLLSLKRSSSLPSINYTPQVQIKPYEIEGNISKERLIAILQYKNIQDECKQIFGIKGEVPVVMPDLPSRFRANLAIYDDKLTLKEYEERMPLEEKIKFQESYLEGCKILLKKATFKEREHSSQEMEVYEKKTNDLLKMCHVLGFHFHFTNYMPIFNINMDNGNIIGSVPNGIIKMVSVLFPELKEEFEKKFTTGMIEVDDIKKRMLSYLEEKRVKENLRTNQNDLKKERKANNDAENLGTMQTGVLMANGQYNTNIEPLNTVGLQGQLSETLPYSKNNEKNKVIQEYIKLHPENRDLTTFLNSENLQTGMLIFPQSSTTREDLRDKQLVVIKARLFQEPDIENNRELKELLAKANNDLESAELFKKRKNELSWRPVWFVEFLGQDSINTFKALPAQEIDFYTRPQNNAFGYAVLGINIHNAGKIHFLRGNLNHFNNAYQRIEDIRKLQKDSIESNSKKSIIFGVKNLP